MRSILPVLWLVLPLLSAPPARADSGEALEGAPAGMVRAVEEATGGRVLAVERVEREGVPGIRFRVLTPDGRIRHVWRPLTGGGGKK